MEPIELDKRTWNGLEYLESVSGPGAIAEMVQDYLQDVPVRMARMKVALETDERDLLGRLAHDLKSNSATIGALQLSSMAARMEHESECAVRDDLQAWLKEIEAMLPAVFSALADKLKLYPE
jgi:HPt (histidine-containing phosphotransfer) domain-containing protein